MIETHWHDVAGQPLMQVRVGGALAGDAAAGAAALFEQAVATLEAAGFAPDRIVRSRVWARDAGLRQIVSDARLQALRGERRGASASFIAPRRLAPGIDAAVDLLALSGPQPKQVVEYEPRLSPPRYVAREGLVFLSGLTDPKGDFLQQVETIAGLISGSLAAAGTSPARICEARAFVHASVPWATAREALARVLPIPFGMTEVEGYSAPEKRVEIEITARA